MGSTRIHGKIESQTDIRWSVKGPTSGLKGRGKIES